MIIFSMKAISSRRSTRYRSTPARRLSHCTTTTDIFSFRALGCRLGVRSWLLLMSIRLQTVRTKPVDVDVGLNSSTGATRIIPDSHKWGSDRRGQPEETVPALCPEGGVVYFISTLWH